MSAPEKAVEPETVRRDSGELIVQLLRAFEARGKVSNIKSTSFVGLCPCHADTTPSLSVKAGDEMVVMMCRACGAGAEQVLDALQLRADDGEVMTTWHLRYEARKWPQDVVDEWKASGGTRPRKAKPTASPPATRHDEKVVTIEKAKAKAAQLKPPAQAGSFVDAEDRQRLVDAVDVVARLDAERGIDADTVTAVGLGLARDGRVILPTYGRDGEPAPRLWIPFADQRTDDRTKMTGAKGARPDLFPRPETPAYPDGSPVILVEGEPDALCGIAHGLQVVGCPGTNGWDETNEHDVGDAARFVRFGRVTVIADADTAGRKWAAKVERDLRAAGVRVVVRDFGDRVHKGFDLTDLALRCRERDETIVDAIERLPMIVAGSQTSDLFGEPEPAAVADVGGCLFYKGSTHVLFGESTVGKTYLFLVAARDEIRNGGRVLFVDYETGVSTIRRRLDQLGFTDAEKARFIHLDVKADRAQPLSGNRDQLGAYLDTFVPTLIGVDSWTSVHGAGGFGDQKDDEPVERVVAQVFRPLTRDGAAVVILDHIPKGETAAKGHPFGSQRKRGAVDVAVEAKRSGRGRVALKGWKDATGDREDNGTVIAEYVYADGMAAIVPADPTKASSAGSTFRPTTLMQRVSEALEAAGDDGLTATEIEQTVTGKAPAMRMARNLLVDEGYARRSSTAPDGSRFSTTRFMIVKPYRQADDPHADELSATS